VFTRHVMHVEPALRNDAVGVVELGWFREMGDVAGMNDEGWLDCKRIDLGERFLERAERVRICRLIESDMAVADLEKGQPARFGSSRLADNADRTRYAGSDGPQDPGTSPGHAFEDFAPADAARLTLIRTHRQSPLKPARGFKQQIADVAIYSCACGSAA